MPRNCVNNTSYRHFAKPMEMIVSVGMYDR